MQITTIGIDLAKNVFQIHVIDASGKVLIKRQLRRSQVLAFFEKQPPCLVGMEACASAYHWARELAAHGHDVRLMPASYVKAYVRRNKNDAADAAAICEAVTRPTLRFVPVKSVEQQSALMLHRARDLLVRQRTQLINAIRAHLAEMGLVASAGNEGAKRDQRLITQVFVKADAHGAFADAPFDKEGLTIGFRPAPAPHNGDNRDHAGANGIKAPGSGCIKAGYNGGKYDNSAAGVTPKPALQRCADGDGDGTRQDIINKS